MVKFFFEVLMIVRGACTAVLGLGRLGMVNVRVTVVMVAMVATEVCVWGGASADVEVGKWCIELNTEKRRSEVAETM